MKLVLKIEVAEQTVVLLEELAKIGVYGVTAEEVAARFVECRLEELIHTPIWSVTGKQLATITRKPQVSTPTTKRKRLNL
jgi:hypothetical protein